MYYYDLNLEEGGDCAVIKQFNVTTSRGVSKRRNSSDDFEDGDDRDDDEEEVVSSGSPEGSMNVLSGCIAFPYVGRAGGAVTHLQSSLFSQPTVAPSYADRLRNRHPHDMTGNSLLKFGVHVLLSKQVTFISII